MAKVLAHFHDQNKQVINVVAPSVVVKDQIFLINSNPVVALENVESGIGLNAYSSGKFEFPKTTGTAWTGGQKLQWDNTAGTFKTWSAGAVNGYASGASSAVSDRGDVILIYAI